MYKFELVRYKLKEITIYGPFMLLMNYNPRGGEGLSL